MVFRQLYRQIITLCLLLASWSSIAASSWQTPSYDMRTYDNMITQLYGKAKIQQFTNMAARIDFFSQAFLGKPYELGALGEGPKGHYDQKPFYRTDNFDCLTYVSTVLAMANSHSFKEFKKKMAVVQYRNGQINYLKRNHFTSLDWNKSNQKLGYIKDITQNIKNEAGWPIYKTASAYINKRAWYQHKNLDTLNLLKTANEQQAVRILTDLKNQGQQLKNAHIEIDYLPLAALFDKQGRPNFYIFSQIPHGAIVEIVRPNWNLEKKMGTNLHISHLGFVIYTDEGIMFREASLIEKKVRDVSLIDYLRKYIKSPTVKGINIQMPQ